MSKVDYLLSTQAIRDRAADIFALSKRGEGQFELHLDKLDAVADIVINTIREKYPQWDIPYHSRWGHFKVGGQDRVDALLKDLTTKPLVDKIRALFDLVIVSVLLDAGAGADWRYHAQDGHHYARSEGLAIASLEMFQQGIFSADPSDPLRVDSATLINFTPEKLAQGFQVTADNPLSGLAGRADLLKRLGYTVALSTNRYFAPDHRPGNLFDFLQGQTRGGKIEARHILDAVLRGLGPIWPGRISLEGINLGDCWHHDIAGLTPFHKLSQWLTYSLLEPLEMAGLQIVKLDELTPLAEYRNGGLLIDTGLIIPKNPDAYAKAWQPDSTLVIEWRALTIVLIDQLAERIRQKMNRSAEALPLAKILEGGTWWAGRKLANEKRSGKPPLEIISDGTVF